MRNYIRNIIISLTACFIPLFANADFLSKSGACWTDTEGCDEFWYCGEQSTGCAGNSPWGCDTKYWLYHGDSFTKHSRKFWCCDGTRSKSGLFKEGANWIVKTEVATETFANGKCTWTRKTNICGQVDNPEDKCTQPTPCPNGTVWHANQCVSPCSEGSAFASSSSYNCEPCEPVFRQGEKNGICIKCTSNQFFDQTSKSCVALSSKVQVSSNAFNDCWMCVTPGAMYNCLKTISNNGSLDSNADLAAACSVNSKDKDATKFKLPEKTFKLKLLPVDLKDRQNPAALNLKDIMKQR